MPYTEQLTKETLPTLNDLENLDTFILGSDQMWNPWNGWVNDDDFLDFVYPRNKTIAYSVSFKEKQIQVNMILNGLQTAKKILHSLIMFL